LPGKSEAHLMLSFQGDVSMAFQGKKTDAAYLRVSIFGKAERAAFEALTKVLCEVLGRVLGIDKSHVYIQYDECTHWGWNGFNL
jgi:phenylpyruvate tautomerase PptA (4-oxalocrotonate tautomerase family)